MNTRRKIVVAIGSGVLAPFASFAQQTPAKIFRIGLLHIADEASVVRRGVLGVLRAGLADFGWVEGKNFTFELRYGDHQSDRLPALAAELVALKVDLIVTLAPRGVEAVSRATKTIPIVVQSSGDLVAAGVAASMARPGGNVTGSNIFFEEVMVKRLEFLKETMPRIARAAILLVRQPENPAVMQVMQAAAKALKLQVQSFEVDTAADIESAFAAMAKQRMDAVIVSDHPLLLANAKPAAELAAARRMLSIGFSGYAAQGGALDYGVDFLALWRRVGYFADKILKGAKPGEIPIEQPTKFDFGVNQKTVTALGIKLPGSILIRATKVIE